MHEHIMTNADQNKADAIKNEILDLCLARRVSALVALSASRCAAECFEEIIKEQGGEVFEVNGTSDSARRAALEINQLTMNELGRQFVGPNYNALLAIIQKHFAAAPTDSDAELIQLLRQRRKYYDEEIFRPWTIEEGRKVQITFPNAVDRIAADSARRIIDVIISDIQAGEHHVSAD